MGKILLGILTAMFVFVMCYAITDHLIASIITGMIVGAVAVGYYSALDAGSFHGPGE